MRIYMILNWLKILFYVELNDNSNLYVQSKEMENKYLYISTSFLPV